MNILQYLDMTGLSFQQLSIITGVSRQSLYKYANGEIPLASIAEKIRKATGGRISAERLLQGK